MAKTARHFCFSWTAVGVGILLCASPSESVAEPVRVLVLEDVTVVTSLSTVYSSMAWSPDGNYFILSERSKNDGTIRFCIYSTKALTRQKCIATLPSSQEMFVGGIDWVDNRLFFEVGYIERPSIASIDIRDWKSQTFKEVVDTNAWRFIVGRYGRCPAWDSVEQGLYFGSTVEFGGVYFEKNGSASIRIKDGICVKAEPNYVWYTAYGEQAPGIHRIRRGRKDIQVITDGKTFSDSEFSVSTNGQLLFVRTDPQSDSHWLYGFIEGSELIGPLLDAAKLQGKPRSVAINRDGTKALVSIHDEKNSRSGENVQRIVLLELLWTARGKGAGKGVAH